MTKRERIFGFALSVWLGLLFARGFLPVTNSFYYWLEPHLSHSLAYSPEIMSLIRHSCFPLLAALMYLSLPGQVHRPKPIPISSLLGTFVGAVLISLVAGIVQRDPTTHLSNLHTAYWLLVCIPIGEELLFRGWLFRVIERIWAGKYFTASNPLPASVTLSALSFSLWHLQNVSTLSTATLCLQLIWTFYAGLWLGYLRWMTGGIWLAVLGHISINLAFSLPW